MLYLSLIISCYAAGEARNELNACLLYTTEMKECSVNQYGECECEGIVIVPLNKDRQYGD